jgi:hypothetical protein
MIYYRHISGGADVGSAVDIESEVLIFGGGGADVDEGDSVEGGGDGIKSSRNPGMKGVMRSRVSFHINRCSSSRESVISPPGAGGGTRIPDACMTSTRFLIDSGTASNCGRRECGRAVSNVRRGEEGPNRSNKKTNPLTN